MMIGQNKNDIKIAENCRIMQMNLMLIIRIEKI